MEKIPVAPTVPTVPTVPIRPNTLILRPMQYKHPIGIDVYFWGIFGCDADSKNGQCDVWVGTFFDRNEAEAFIIGSKTFGQLVNGVRLETVETPKLEVPDARESDRKPPTGAS